MTEYLKYLIHNSSQRGDLQEVLRMLNNNSTLIELKGECDWTPIFYAIRGEQIEIVLELILRGANLQARANDSNNFTPLHLATNLGFKKIVELLLEAGADKDALANDQTSLEIAKCEDVADLFRNYADKKIRIDEVKSGGRKNLKLKEIENIFYDGIKTFIESYNTKISEIMNSDDYKYNRLFKEIFGKNGGYLTRKINIYSNCKIKAYDLNNINKIYNSSYIKIFDIPYENFESYIKSKVLNIDIEIYKSNNSEINSNLEESVKLELISELKIISENELNKIKIIENDFKNFDQTIWISLYKKDLNDIEMLVKHDKTNIEYQKKLEYLQNKFDSISLPGKMM